MAIRTLIIDDEPMARGVIKKHLEKLDAFEVIGECGNAIEAINVLQKEKVDVLFLDIQMPEITGLDFMKTLKNPPLIVLATAYSDFGVDSYEFENVVDYLLKPISFDRFLKTSNRIFEKLKLVESHVPAKEVSNIESIKEQESVFLKADKKIHKVNINEIHYLQAYGNYVKIFTSNQGMIMVLQKFQEFEDTLPKHKFVRIHKSYIAGIEHISTMEGNRLFIQKVEIPIGITFKHRLEAVIKN